MHRCTLVATFRRRLFGCVHCPTFLAHIHRIRLVQSTFARWGAPPYLSGASTRLHILAASLGLGLHHQRRSPLKQGMLRLSVSPIAE